MSDLFVCYPKLANNEHSKLIVIIRNTYRLFVVLSFRLCLILQDFPIETVYKTIITFEWVYYDFYVTFSYFLLLQSETNVNMSRLTKDY